MSGHTARGKDSDVPNSRHPKYARTKLRLYKEKQRTHVSVMKMPNRVALKTPFLSTKKADITGPEMNPKTSRARGNGEMRGNTVSRIGKTVSWTEKAASLTPEMISLTDGTIAAAEAPLNIAKRSMLRIFFFVFLSAGEAVLPAAGA